jgi:methylenetetrahydrofolate--tRNA-(uracil-5-)-methyltransferase
MSRGEAVRVVGAGLAGAEAAWSLVRAGIPVRLIEMRPVATTPAHGTDRFAELVCSNSLGADAPDSPAGILKEELERLGSLILACARRHRVPAGKALAVDREGFARSVTETLSSHPLVTVERAEVTELPEEPAILATGPLTSAPLAEALKGRIGEDFLSFYDASAPIVTLESVDPARVWRGGRWGKGEDYLNCPLDEEEYRRFVEALASAVPAPRHEFERVDRHFEGCLPVEVMARRGTETLRYGPLRPVGLTDPRTGREPYAVVQLRQDNLEGTLYNLVGFQTSLLFGEQERVFRMIPALAEAEFVRKGVMHRNLFVRAPRVLDGFLRPRGSEALFLAGQMTGVEGYVESAAMGLVAGRHLCRVLVGLPLPRLPRETMIGSLLHYLSTAEPDSFQPMNANLGILPPLERRIKERTARCLAQAERSRGALEGFLGQNPDWLPPERRDEGSV